MWRSELRGDALKEREVGLGLRQESFKSWLCPWAAGGPWASCVAFLNPGPHLLRDLSGTESSVLEKRGDLAQVIFKQYVGYIFQC